MQQAQRAEKSVEVCLRGDLQAEWERLDKQLRDLHKQPRESLADDGGAAIVEQMNAIAAEMRGAMVTLRFRALPRREWFKLLTEHPPRDDNKFDKALGLNQDSFFDDVVPKSLIDPQMAKDELAEFLDLLSGAQYQAITNAVWEINASEVSVPFSPIASRMTADSAETSRQPSKPASRSGGGTGGSRRKSPSTSTKTGD